MSEENENVEKKDEVKKEGPCCVCPMKCKYPICLLVIGGLIIWFVLRNFL